MTLTQSLVRGSRSLLLLALTLFSLAPTTASAATEYNETIQFSDDFDSCSGERVLVSGTQHIVGRSIPDAAGKLHFGFTRNTKGTGIGQISGDKYLLTDAFTRASLELVSGAGTTLIEQYDSRLIHQGEDGSKDDTIVHFVSKITVTADGNVIPVVQVGGVECR
ncbi:MAG TPA: hypothetical protein VK249_33875 [Anaerolineales bacterium]|nr:hypothetical protein [Anaerolineales bacterium]